MRTIAILSSLMKLYELTILQLINKHIDQNNLIHKTKEDSEKGTARETTS